MALRASWPASGRRGRRRRSSRFAPGGGLDRRTSADALFMGVGAVRDRLLALASGDAAAGAATCSRAGRPACSARAAALLRPRPLGRHPARRARLHGAPCGSPLPAPPRRRAGARRVRAAGLLVARRAARDARPLRAPGSPAGDRTSSFLADQPRGLRARDRPGGRRRPRAAARARRSGCWSAAALAAVAVADLSGLSKGEVERIWLPFVPWVLLATAALTPALRAAAGSPRSSRSGIALQAGVRSPW